MTDSIIATVPFTYELEFVQPKKRATTTAWVVEGMPVKIPLIDGEDAKLVVARSSGKNGPDQFEMRVHDGRLYGRLTDLWLVNREGTPIEGVGVTVTKPSSWNDTWEHRKEIGTPLEAFLAAMQAVVDGKAALDCQQFPLPLAKDAEIRGSLGRPVDDILIARVVRSEKESTMERMGALASTAFIVVDGMVYVEEKEPRWVLSCYHGDFGNKVSWTLSLKRSHCSLRREPKSHTFDLEFRMDRLEGARTLAALKGEEVRGDAAWTIDRDHPWSREVDGALALRWASKAVRHMEVYGLNFFRGGDEVHLAFMELRRTVAGGSIGLREAKERVDALIACIRSDARTPSEQAKRMDAIGIAPNRRIEMFGYEQDASVEEQAPDLDEFVLD